MTEVVRCCGNCTFYISDMCVDGAPKNTFSIPCHRYEHKRVKAAPKPEPKFKVGQTVHKAWDSRVWTITSVWKNMYELRCASQLDPNIYYTVYSFEEMLKDASMHECLKGLEGPDNTEYYRVSVGQKFDQRLTKLEQELVENAQNDSTIEQRLSTLEQAVLKLINKDAK